MYSKLPVSTEWKVEVNNGTARQLKMGIDGIVTVPNNLYVKVGTYTGIFTHSNTANRTYTFPDRTGTVSLQDNTALNAMLPSQTGNSGKFFTTDGTNTAWASITPAQILTLNGSGIAAQTFATPGTTGTAPSWATVTGTGVHTLHIPLAATTSVTAGLFSNADYLKIPFKDAASNTFVNAPLVTNTSTATNALITYGQALAMKAGLAARAPINLLDIVSNILPTTGDIDSVTPTVNMRVLFTALSSGANKVYKLASVGPYVWTLETDGQSGDGTPSDGDILFIKQGTAYHDQQWAYNGTAWVLYNVANAYTFSTGLTVTGTTISVDFAASGVSSSTKAVRADDSRLSDARTPVSHTLLSHTASGLTAGQLLLATAATTFNFVVATGDLSIAGTGATQLNKVGGVNVADLGLTYYSTTLTDNAVTVIDFSSLYNISTYRTLRVDYSITRGTNYVVGYMILLYDGSILRLTYIEDDSVGDSGCVFSATTSSGIMNLICTATSTGTSATMRYTVKAFLN